MAIGFDVVSVEPGDSPAKGWSSGDPKGEGALLRPRYDDASDQRINFDAETTVITGFRRPECEFWWGVYDAEFE